MNANELLPAWLGAVEIGCGCVPDHLAPASHRGLLYEANRQAALLEIPEIARLHLQRGQITLAPLTHFTPERLGFYLRRTPLAILTFLAGGFAANAAAVAGPDGAVLLLGPSVTGKSTLAAALLQRGLRLLADDAAPLMPGADGRAMVMPVWPELVLWPDAVGALFPTPPDWLTPDEVAGLPRWRIAASQVCAEPLAIKRSYVLHTADHQNEASEVRGIFRLTHSSLVPFHPDLVMAYVDPRVLLSLYGGLGAVEHIHLPHRHLNEITALADKIIEDCRWSAT